MTFARELKAWRKRSKLSMSQAAMKLGVSKRTFENWEYGRNTPSPLALEALRSKLKPKRPAR